MLRTAYTMCAGLPWSARQVVASDGHSYERKAIESVLHGSGVSPLTRETLAPGVLIPNIALRKRIRSYDEEILCIAEAANAAGEKRGAAAASAAGVVETLETPESGAVESGAVDARGPREEAEGAATQTAVAKGGVRRSRRRTGSS